MIQKDNSTGKKKGECEMYSNYSMEVNSSYKRSEYEEQGARERMARQAQAGRKSASIAKSAAVVAKIAQAVKAMIARKARHSARPA